MARTSKDRDHLRGLAPKSTPSPSSPRRRSPRASIPEKYEPFYIGITSSGAWKLCDGPDAELGERQLPARPCCHRTEASRGLLVLEHGRYETIRLDLVLPVLHGKLGEDGAIQGLLELSGIPYVGCDVQSSALCMDKSLAYLVARDAGIATPDFWTVTARRARSTPGQLTYPVFVKPARSGSSFGVSKVSRDEDLPSAVEAARQYDSKVLIEEAVVGSEVGCAILSETIRTGGRRGRPDRPLPRLLQDPSGEPNPRRVPRTPASSSPRTSPAEARALVQETAKTIYRALGCTGLARVDLFLKEDGTVVLNEVNTLPGLTSYSRYPRMMAAAGLPLAEVIDRLVSPTLAREEAMNDDFVFVDELVPGIRWDAKYATWDNFTGKPVDGYLANRIVGTTALCAALRRARDEGRIPGLRPAPLGRLSAATRRGSLHALVEGAGGWPDEAAALSEHRPGRDVRPGLRRHQVGPQPGQHRRPDALSTWRPVSSPPWAATMT